MVAAIAIKDIKLFVAPVILGGDPAPVRDPAEHDRDPVACAVELLAAADLAGAAGATRNAREGCSGRAARRSISLGRSSDL